MVFSIRSFLFPSEHFQWLHMFLVFWGVGCTIPIYSADQAVGIGELLSINSHYFHIGKKLINQKFVGVYIYIYIHFFRIPVIKGGMRWPSPVQGVFFDPKIEFWDLSFLRHHPETFDIFWRRLSNKPCCLDDHGVLWVYYFMSSKTAMPHQHDKASNTTGWWRILDLVRMTMILLKTGWCGYMHVYILPGSSQICHTNSFSRFQKGKKKDSNLTFFLEDRSWSRKY